MRMQCGTCAGTYATQTVDGCRYFHACPPLLLLEIVRDSAVLEVALSDLRSSDIVKVYRNGAAIDVAIAAMLPDDFRLGERERPRPNARNENVDPTKARETSPIIAEGRGAVAVP